MWFGTSSGLKKYDGYKITEYLHNPNDYGSISNNKVLTIYEDPSDSGKILWIGTRSGLEKFDRTTDKFIRMNVKSDDTSNQVYESVQSICKDRNGNYWLGGRGFKKFDKATEKLSSQLTNIDPLIVYSIVEDRFGFLWLGSNLGLIKFDPQSNDKEGYNLYTMNKDNPFKSSRTMISSVLKDSYGKLWVGIYDGIFLFNRESEQFERPNLKVGNPKTALVSDIIEDKDRNIWNVSAALIKINSSRDTLIKYIQLTDENDTTSRVGTYAIHIDRSGIIWVGLGNNGINKLIPIRSKFKHYKHIPGNDYSLLYDDVTAFIEDKRGTMWIGTTFGGLNKFEKKTDRFFIAGVSPLAYNISMSPTGVLWYPSLSCLSTFDPSNSLHGANFGNGVKFPSTIFKISDDPMINLKKRNQTYNSTNKDLIEMRDVGNGIFYCFIDSKEVIWTLHGQGKTIKQYDIVNDEYIPYEIITDEGEVVSNSIQMLFEDSNETLWLGTNGKGLIKRIENNIETTSVTKNKFYQYRNKINDPNSLSNNIVNVICEDKQGNLWIGTEAGLNKFDPNSELFTLYGIKDRLPSESIAGIVIDDYGKVWISTNKGLSRFDPDMESFKNFDESSGLQSNTFYKRSCYKDSEGFLYFGGPNVFNMFNPVEIQENEITPEIKFTGFQIFNKSIIPGKDSPLKQSIEFCKEIVLDFDQDVFTIEFAGLEFTNPDKNKYAYKMESVDPDWVYTDANRRFATYTKLDPGEYTFRIKGSNNDGFWNEAGASISIIILPPWWKTYLAYTLYFLFIISMIFAAWHFQTGRLQLKHQAELDHLQAEKLQEMDQLKSRFFANISHEFRTPLTLILGPIKKVMEQTGEVDTKKDLTVVQRNANRLYELVNQLLDISKLEAGKMELKTKYVDIIPILKGLVLSFVSLAETKKLELHFNSFIKSLHMFVDVDTLRQIINNLLSNAIKFTPEGGKVEVDVSKKGNSVEIKISDTGVGISQKRLNKIFDRFYQVDGNQTREFKGTGIGLSLTKELVELHKGKITVESEERLLSADKAGKVGRTAFTVTLPLGKNHLKAKEIVEKYDVELKQLSKLEINELEKQSGLNNDNVNVDLIMNTDKPILLIVEDNTDVRNYITGYFEKDYILIEAADGSDGLEKSLQYIPDIIISDVMMPKMDGFKLLEKLKTDEKTSHIPVVLLTAKASDQYKIEGLQIGADDYMMKPFDALELQVRVRNLIEQRKRLREHFKKEGIFEIRDEKLTLIDKQFLKKGIEIINLNLSNNSFSVEVFAEKIAMSRSQLHRKLIAVIDESPGGLIRRIRMTTAAKLIKQKFGNISEIALEVGYNNPANFTRSFTKQFGISPSEYQNKKSKI